MSHESVTWAMDDAPMLRTASGKADTTSRHILAVIAEHANSGGTGTYPSDKRIQYRTGYDRRTVQRALRRLEAGGLIRPVGEVKGCTHWALAMHLIRPESDWTDLEREEDEQRKAAAERQRRSRAKRTTASDSMTVTHSKDVTTDVTHSNAVTSRTLRPHVTHSASECHALNAARTTKQPPAEPKDSSAPALLLLPTFDGSGREIKASSKKKPDPQLEKFGAFWLVYPKKKAKAEAQKAWANAIDDGADPDHIVKAATAYARERANQDPKFTKYPATWLNKGCYDDEPDPHVPQQAAAGGWQPHRNHIDQSAYDEWN